MRPALITISIAIVLLFLAFQPDRTRDRRQEIDMYFSQGLINLKESLKTLGSFVKADSSRLALQEHFKKTRLSYKKIAVISDYFNGYHSKLLNGPAIARIEDDAPHRIIEAHGFQKLEELLWEENLDRNALMEEILVICGVIGEMEKEPDRKFKYRDAETWQAFYEGIIRITALGLSGFDSPIALHSIPECAAVLKGIDSVLLIYEDEFCCDRAMQFRNIRGKIKSAISFLGQSKSFNRFDRLTFIKLHLNPLSAEIKSAARNAGYILDEGRRPLSVNARNIFDITAFDTRFFSPNRRNQATTERIELGELLFNDKRLSGNLTRSCASCHNPSRSFTDGLPKAIALEEKQLLNRNTPSLWNAVFQTKQFYDSRQSMLEFQVSDVVHNVNEMHGALDSSVLLFSNDKNFMEKYRQAYPAENGKVSSFTLSNAIANYVRSLTAMNTRFDKFMRNEKVNYSKKEINGFNLFMGKAKCGTCHFIPLFNGLTPPVFTESESEVLGVPSSVMKPYRIDTDSGKYFFTRSPLHLFSFKTPTLRNITLSAPYMHNGIYNTLEEVIDFYNEGGGAGLGIAPENQTLPRSKLDLNNTEKRDLVLFLATLTDTASYRRLR